MYTMGFIEFTKGSYVTLPYILVYSFKFHKVEMKKDPPWQNTSVYSIKLVTCVSM